MVIVVNRKFLIVTALLIAAVLAGKAAYDRGMSDGVSAAFAAMEAARAQQTNKGSSGLWKY